MALTQAQLLTYLTAQQIPYQLYTHVPLFTCEEATKVIAELQIPGAAIKNLFLKDDKGQLYLISAAYDTRVDLKAAGKILGAKGLRFANADLLLNYLGVEPGAVTPLAVINDQTRAVRVILDAQLLKAGQVQMHPLQNSATVVLATPDLLKFLQVLNITPMVYDFVNQQIVSVR